MIQIHFLSVHKNGKSSVTLLQQGFLLIVQTVTPADTAYSIPEKTVDEIYTQNDHELAYARFMELSKADTIKAY